MSSRFRVVYDHVTQLTFTPIFITSISRILLIERRSREVIRQTVTNTYTELKKRIEPSNYISAVVSKFPLEMYKLEQ